MSMYLSSYAQRVRINETISAIYERISNAIYSISLIRNLGTVTAIAAEKHGYSNADSVVISGATQSEYNGTYTIAVIDDYTFTYTITGTPTSPATGTIFATLAKQSPISIDMLIKHIRVDVYEEQLDYLQALIDAVTRIGEDYCNLSFLQQKWRTYRNNFDQMAIELRKGYFVSLDKFQYLKDGNYIDVDSDIYYISKQQAYNQIKLQQNKDYPYNDIDMQDNAILIEFTAGIARNQEDVPFDLKLALLNHAAFAYENRGNNDVAGFGGSGAGAEDSLNSIPNISKDVYKKYRIADITSAYTYTV